jgi:hypothetical protein
MNNSLTFRRSFKSGSLCELIVGLYAVRSENFAPSFNWKGPSVQHSKEFFDWAGLIHLSVIEHLGLEDFNEEIGPSIHFAVALNYAQPTQRGPAA